jgi:hypothetical protein
LLRKHKYEFPALFDSLAAIIYYDDETGSDCDHVRDEFRPHSPLVSDFMITFSKLTPFITCCSHFHKTFLPCSHDPGDDDQQIANWNSHPIRITFFLPDSPLFSAASRTGMS